MQSNFLQRAQGEKITISKQKRISLLALHESAIAFLPLQRNIYFWSLLHIKYCISIKVCALATAACVFDNDMFTLCQCLRYRKEFQQLKAPDSLQRTFTYISLKAANHFPKLSLSSHNAMDTPLHMEKSFPPTPSLLPAAETFHCLYHAVMYCQSFPYPTWQIFILLSPVAQVDVTLPH